MRWFYAPLAQFYAKAIFVHNFLLPFTHWRSLDYTKWNNISNSRKISIEPDVGFEWLLPQNQQLFAFSEAVTHNHHRSGSRCWHRHGQQSHTGLGGNPFAGSKERTLAIMTNYRGSWCELSWQLAQSIVAAATKRKWAHSHPTTFMSFMLSLTLNPTENIRCAKPATRFF